jgi:hypothetical protein
MDKNDWPTADGNSGITSSKVMDDVEAAGRAIEVGSNFFLFFRSQSNSTGDEVHFNHMHASVGSGH